MKFLFEIGVEELPSRYVSKASLDFKELFKKELENERIGFSNIYEYNSPRRIAIYIENIDEIQKDLYEKKLGPSINVAYKDGNLTKAALGFLNSNNVSENEIKIEKTDKGEYIYIEKNIKGLETKNIISKIMDKVIRNLEFDKSMKWSDKTFRFARPIKWILATLNDEIIDFEFEGIKASNLTRGMRIYGSQSIEIKDSSKYEEILLKEFVVVDPIKRKNMILESIKNNAENDGDKVIINNYLLDEVYNLVEYPYAIKGEFNENYLNLPEDIITITMETHQRYFPVKDVNGKLTNKFVLIRNAPEYSELVKLGNEKVIEPRLADAKFFFDEDLKIKLDDNVEKLKNVTFQKDMGTIYDKVYRLKEIAKYLVKELKLENLESILRTIHLSKADLVSNVVSEKEFTKLQGFMGSIYAKNEAEEENVAKGIFEHYLPRYQGDILASTNEGAITSIVDKLDTVIGCFSVGLIPTSSKDPYALRRATQGLILTALNSKYNIDYKELIKTSFDIFSKNKKVLNEKSIDNVLEFFVQRLETILSINYDKKIISYLINKETKLQDLITKIEYLESLSKTEEFEQIVNIVNRLKNISKNINIDSEINEDLFIQNEEKEIYELYNNLNSGINNLEILLNNKEKVDNFFEKVIINVEDEKIKNNRNILVYKIANKILDYVNF